MILNFLDLVVFVTLRLGLVINHDAPDKIRLIRILMF